GGHVETDTTEDPDLHLVVDGKRLQPAFFEGRVCTFTVEARPAAEVRLSSRSDVPSLLGITRHDHRRVGVAVRGIELRQQGVVTAFDHDAPLFGEGGCHRAENGYCWTDGEFELPAWVFAHLSGPFTLTVHFEKPGMRYSMPAAGRMAA
ncbi:MAG TPA: hypothetical protein VHU15_08275, partial [Stellaceae bacterium]|nr:hypothetical protein [Stellaceae bacterium]